MTSPTTIITHCVTKNVTNQREHWHKRQAREHAVKVAVASAMLVKRRDWPALPVDVLLTRIAPRSLDVGDNLPAALKGARDAIAKFFGVDDGETELIRFDYAQRRGRVKEYGIEISIAPRRTG